MAVRKIHFLVFLIGQSLGFQPLASQIVPEAELFPQYKLVPTFPADPTSHKMKAENIMGKKDIRAALGGYLPVLGVQLLGRNLELSTGASVFFDVHPNGSAQIVSSEFYIDFMVVDFHFLPEWSARALAGHTSHHLSDNTYEKLGLQESVNYSRDYVGAFLIHSVKDYSLVYAGINYGYIFHFSGDDHKPWRFQLGGERTLFHVVPKLSAYIAVDFKLYQEYGYEFANAYQLGTKIPSGSLRLFRLAYQFRHGVDERGQFFPKHRTLHTIGIIVEL